MKKNRHIASFLGGALTALALAACLTTALAASGKVSYNFANVSVEGTRKITAGQDIVAANGQKIPGTILYTDAAGGKTNYLPIRTISELLGVEVGYDSASKTIQLGKQPAASPGADSTGGDAIDLRTPASVPEHPRRGDTALIMSRGGTILPDDDPESYMGNEKLFQNKDGERWFEYIVGNEGALDELDKKLASKHLVNGDYPKNGRGESYGPAQLARYVGYKPDLFYAPAEGDHPDGYYRQSERLAEGAKYENLSKKECPHQWSILLYDSEGNVIGNYNLGCGGHFEGMTLEEVKEAMERGDW